MQIGLRKTTDGEFDMTGGPFAIRNLSYQFMVTGYLNVWQVTGKDDRLQTAYIKSDVPTDRTDTADIQISSVFDEHIKQNSIENPGFDQPDDMGITHMTSGIEAVSHRLPPLDPQAYGKNKQEDIAFEVRQKRDGLGPLTRCDHLDSDPKGSPSCSLTGDDLYQDVRAPASLSDMSVGTHGYFIVSPLQLMYDLSQITFDQNPGGIYQLENDKSRRIVSLPLGKQDTLRMVSTEKNVIALVTEKSELSLYTYDSNGGQLDRSALSTALVDITELTLLLDQNNRILFGYGNGFECVFQMYEQKNTSPKQIDRADISTNADSSGPLQLQYDQGVLYCMQEGDQTIRIMITNHRGMLRSSEVCSNYREDDPLGYLDLNEGLDYERIIRRCLFDDR